MLLLDHVSIGVLDLDAARPFYDAIMTALGARKVYDRPDANWLWRALFGQ